jgi:predicted lysophospholipase L1 biosynthesis ABC-type transport system permease subunit
MDLKRGLSTMVWSLRTYPVPAIWIASVGALALGAALPAVSINAQQLPAVPQADLGINWTELAISPTQTQHRMIGELRTLLSGLTGTTIAIAVLTVAVLSLMQARARRTEIAVRRAVGASLHDLWFDALLQSLPPAMVAITLGMSMGLLATRRLAASWPGTATVHPFGQPSLMALAVIVAAIAIGAVAAVALQATQPRRVTPVAVPPGLAIVCLQLGASFALLVAGAQIREYGHRALGKSVEAAAAGGSIVTLNAAAAPPARRAEQFDSLLHALGQDRRIDLVSLTSSGTLAGLGIVDFIVADCGHCWQGGIATPQRLAYTTIHAASPDTFNALGISVVAGRGFNLRDRWGSQPVAIVNEALAAREFESGHAVGRRILPGVAWSGTWHTIIGVVRDRPGRGFGVGLQPPFVAYVSSLQHPPDRVELLVRPRSSDAGNAGLRQSIRAAAGAAGTIDNQDSEARAIAAAAVPLRWFGRLLALVGDIALLIAVLGTFATMRAWVARLEPELSLRRAIGATRRSIYGFVLLRAVLVGIAGVLIGLWLGLVVSDPLRLAAPVPGRTPGLLLFPAVVLVAAAIASAVTGAWRAAGRNPAPLLATLES